MKRRNLRTLIGLTLIAAVGGLFGCLKDSFLGGVVSGVIAGGEVKFTPKVVQSHTFINGVAVNTATYAVDDLSRTPMGIDFNGDGRIDPVIGYGPSTAEGATQAVIQILLSSGAVDSFDFTSLTLDAKLDWSPLSDVAAADIDGDGFLDLIAATGHGVVYLHHPSNGDTTDLAAWGAEDAVLELLEGSTTVITNDELTAILAQAIGPGVNLDDYDITIEQGYTRVVPGDMNGDGHMDIVASRRLVIIMNPKPSANVQPISIIDGVVQIFINPGNAIDGTGWALLPVGTHERHTRLDRDGASGVLLYDLDGDGDLDIVSAAALDTNAQVMWFENPGGALNPDSVWQPWRIGSVRDALSVDVADLTGDGRPDVLALGGKQQQVVLFEQPATGPKREYDWDTYPIVTFDAFEPRDLRIMDIDNDGVNEFALTGTAGAVRYFEPTSDPHAEWTPVRVADIESQAEVGLLGYGDLDGDGDLDLIVVTNDDKDQNDNTDEVILFRNDLIP